MDNVNSINGQEQARTIENEEPIIETGRFEVYEKGNRGEIDGDAYKKFMTVADDMGSEYLRAYTVDEVRQDGAIQTATLNFRVDVVGYVILDKTTLRAHSIIVPKLVNLDFPEHLNFIINFLRSFDDEEAGKRADVFQHVLEDLDEEPIEGAELQFG